MKNSKKYAEAIKKLFRSLKRQYPKVKSVEYEDVTEALVRGLVLEKMSESATSAAFRRFPDHFVDFNDMRVSRPEEIVEMLGEDNETIRTIASSIITMLGSIFKKYNCLDLSPLKKMGKRQARATLEKFDGVTRFCLDYCMLTALGGHAIPLTETMAEFLRQNDLVHPSADIDEISGFLNRQISAGQGYEFYSLLRKHSEKRKTTATKRKTTRRRTGTKRKTTTKKKTTKKKTS